MEQVHGRSQDGLGATRLIKPELVAGRCEACQCLQSENGMMSGALARNQLTIGQRLQMFSREI